MAGRRVAVTGVGVVSALGRDRRAFWSALVTGRPGIGPIRSVDCSDLRFAKGAEAFDYVSEEHFDPRALDQRDRFSQLALVAAREAAADAGFAGGDGLPGRTAVVTGSCLGGQTTEDGCYRDLNALGAAGALEAAATVLALLEGVLPPTANFTAPDPECDLDVIPNRARAAFVAAALSSSFAFGGLNAVLAFRRADAAGS
jgi:3-oxoacyl-(acyl-carrier-protein) synthase